MFALEIPRLYFYGRIPRAQSAAKRCETTQDCTFLSPQERILEVLEGMLPSTAVEIAEAAGLDPVTAAACLDALAARCRVMFNPLTKRYSLPRAFLKSGLAA